jgi:DNA-binding PadR family transcriptional regulator
LVVGLGTARCAGFGFEGGGLSEVLSQAGEALGQAMSALKGTPAGGGRGPRWERDFGGHGKHGHWGGGAGAWTGFWPGGPGAPGGPGGFGPPRNTKAGRGDVRAAILALLKEGPRTGYQIMSDIKERSEGVWRPSPGAVYPALSQLADEGLIEGQESGGRRTFSLTQAGLDYLERNPDMARAAWESMTRPDDSWEVPGLFAEAARLGGGIMQVVHSGTPAQVLATERLLERARRELYQILADDSGVEPDDTEQTQQT